MKSHKKLEIVHSNVCGPYAVKSLGGNCYFLTFIDKFTKYMQIYLLEKKSEVYTSFKRFNLLIEKQVEYAIKWLGANGDGEYTLTEFAQICDKKESMKL